MIISASDPQPVRIPAQARHTFKVDDTHEGPCTVEISTGISPKSDPEEPEANGANEKLYVRKLSCLSMEVLTLTPASATSTPISMTVGLKA